MADVRLLTEARRLGSPPARSIDVRDWPAQAGQLYAAIVLGEGPTPAAGWPGSPPGCRSSTCAHT